MQIRLDKLVLEKLSFENFLNIVKILHNIKEQKLSLPLLSILVVFIALD